jgi:hypothetical protein
MMRNLIKTHSSCSIRENGGNKEFTGVRTKVFT